MADNSEEEYLDRLLKSAMEQDEKLNDADNSPEPSSEDISKMLEQYDNTDNSTEDDNGDMEYNSNDTALDDESIDFDDTILDDTGMGGDFSDADFLDDDFFSDLDTIEDEDEVEDNVEDNFVLDDSDIPYAATVEPEDAQPLYEEEVTDNVNEPKAVFSEEQPPIVKTESEPAGSTDEESNKPSKKKKEKKKKEKKSKDKKKFSIKNFFVEYEEEPKETDENAELINQLYQDKDSLDKEVITQPEKPKKPKKEKKPKEKKVKKPKEKKLKKEKNTGEKVKLDTKALVISILIAAVIAVTVIVFNNIFTYKRTVDNARSYFDEGKYSEAYDSMSGTDIKDKDKKLYEKVFVMASMTQGLEAYDSFMFVNDVPNALNAVINAVARKNSNEDLIEEYNIKSEADAVYGRLLSILDQYGIDEEKALELYSMDNLAEYQKMLRQYGGVAEDNSNK